MDIVIPSDRGKADNPYPEERPFGRVSKDEARVSASWFKTRAKSALLTMRV
jgi:hypothetical protein